MHRRAFLSAATYGYLSASVFSVSAQETLPETPEFIIDGDLPDLPEDLRTFANEPPAPYTELAVVGSGKPKPAEIEQAHNILLNSPYNCSHLDVAEYFLGLSGVEATYRREWPVRANPVIYHFFSATETKPEGDVTAWCAAGLNWFILRSHAKNKTEIGKAPGSFSISGDKFPAENIDKYSTHDASSGSFRCWDKREGAPKRGDVVVLKNKGTDGLTRYCRGQGHATIFDRTINKDWVSVIGCNQSAPGSNGAITKASLYIGPGSRFYRFVKIKNA